MNQLTQAGNLFSALGTMQTPMMPKRDIMTLNGYQEAKDLKLDKGERIAALDANLDILYIKECDDIGKYSLKVFECKEITERYEKENTPANISKAEFDSLVASLAEMKALLKENKNELDDKTSKQHELKFTD